MSIDDLTFALRVEGSDLDAQADGSDVTAWGALSASSGTEPTLDKAAINGRSAVAFDGTQYMGGTLTSGTSSSWTRTAVVAIARQSGVRPTLYGSRSTYPEGAWAGRGAFGDETKLRMGHSATQFGVTTDAVDEAFHVVTTQWEESTDTATMYVDGVQEISSTGAYTASRTTDLFWLGAHGNTPDPNFIGRVAAFFHADRLFDATDRATAHSYCQDTYGTPVADYDAGAAQTTGTLPLSLALSGQATPVASATGSLPVTLTLSGTAETVTVPSTTGTLDLTLTLSGVASTVAATTGTLPVTLGLSGAASPVASTTGTLDLTLALSGTATDGSAPQTTGTLGLTITLSGVAENLTPPPVPVTEYLPAGPDPLTSHRTESWWAELLTGDDAPLGTLDGVTGGGVEQNVNRVISGGGSLDVVDRGQDIDWLSARIQLWWQVEGADPWPLGVFLLSAPVEQHTAAGLSWRVELLDKLLVLDEDKVDGSYSLAAGTVVTDAVRTIITSAGETAMAITDSAETLTSGMVWPAGTSKLRIINDLLSAINYFSLRCDGHGRYVAAPYLAPASRPVVRRFVPGRRAIHLPEFTRDRDLAGIPNKTVLVSSGSSDTEALVGVASNTDPDSPTSQPSRGRWIVHTESGVEATSQSVIDNLAARRLIDLSTVTATEEIQHAAVPLDLNDVVALEGADLDLVHAAVQSWSLTLTAGSLMRTKIREVAA